MDRARWAAALRLVGVGWYVAVCIAGGTMLGVWLDSLLGTKVLLTFAGLALGLVAAFWGTLRLLAPIMDTNDKEERKGE